MLTLGIVDANQKIARQYAGMTSGVVAGWLKWEMQKVGIALESPASADVVFLVFSGAIDWEQECRRALARVQIHPSAARRERAPYVITGGPCDAIPLTALGVADALCVGEAYRFVRAVLAMIAAGCSVSDLATFVRESDTAIEREQVVGLGRDPVYPWLLDQAIEPLATPDDYVDWGVPPVRSDDKVVRLIASKGCHKKCSFCATTYRQNYQANSDSDSMVLWLKRLKSQGERVQLLSNDPLHLPYFRNLGVKLDSQSFTVDEIMDDANRRAVLRCKPGMARFGVEGLSERLRLAFGKPVPSEKVLAVLQELHGAKINTHLFFIAGAPYETDRDWEEFQEFYNRAARIVQAGICRIKMTTFVPTPPAPLARFVPARDYDQHVTAFRGWMVANCASRHMLFVSPRGTEARSRNVAEQLSLSKRDAAALCAGSNTTDLAPTLDAARRMPYELVRWPMAVEVRHKIGEVYKRKMLAPGFHVPELPVDMGLTPERA